MNVSNEANDGGVYVCPDHGMIGGNYIQSTMTGKEGKWCQYCFLEALDKLGVKRVMEVKMGSEKKQ